MYYESYAKRLKEADTLSMGYKKLVERGYDSCAGEYERARMGGNTAELELLSRHLKPGAKVLDIGCGSGIPITKVLAKNYQVTGVDISQEQIRRAKENVPGGRFIHADIMAMDFPDESFDAAVSFYTIFHLPREEHPELFRRTHKWLKPGGFFLATLTHEAEQAYTEDDFFGVRMYWSNYGLDDYQSMLKKCGFKLMASKVIGHGYNEECQAPLESHPLIFAQTREK